MHAHQDTKGRQDASSQDHTITNGMPGAAQGLSAQVLDSCPADHAVCDTVLHHSINEVACTSRLPRS